MAIDFIEPSNAPFSEPGEVIGAVYNFGITLAGIIFVIMFLVGGIQYLTASGDKDGTAKAKRLLVDAMIGLLLVLAAWALSDFVLNQFTGRSLQINSSSSRSGSGRGGSGLPTPPQATSREPVEAPPPTTEASDNQASLPSTVAARISVFSTSKNDWLRDGSVAVAIVENSRTSQEKLLISGRPDDIGGLLLNFSPKANATYTIAVVSLQNPPTTLSEQTLDPTQAEHQIKFVIP